MGFTDYIWTLFVVTGFYAMAITVYVYAVPTDVNSEVTSWGQVVGLSDVSTRTEELQESLTKQTNIPLYDAGALVWYSGNIFIDFALNFITAIPQMITQLFSVILFFMNINTNIAHALQLFLTSLAVAGFVFLIIEILLGLRSGKSSTV